MGHFKAGIHVSDAKRRFREDRMGLQDALDVLDGARATVVALLAHTNAEDAQLDIGNEHICAAARAALGALLPTSATQLPERRLMELERAGRVMRDEHTKPASAFALPWSWRP